MSNLITKVIVVKIYNGISIIMNTKTPLHVDSFRGESWLGDLRISVSIKHTVDLIQVPI